MVNAEFTRFSLPMDLGDTAVAPGASCGAVLAAARVRQDLELADIARVTRFAESFIAAIEAEDYTEFAGAVYLIGAVRAYARVVALDETVIIDLLRGEIAARGISWRRSGWLA